MEETSLINSIFRTLALLGILALIVLAGWNEPLKYRFMSRAEIHALENTVSTAKSSWMWDTGRPGKLDRGAYNRSGDSGPTRYGNSLGN